MKQKILAFLGAVLVSAGLMAVVVPAPAMAAAPGGDCGAPRPLGLRPWFDGWCNSNNEVQQPEGEDDTIQFVWTVILNILYDVFLVVGYLTMAFIAYGGFLYIMAQGDPGKAAKGQRTLTAAIIGTIITMSATVIVNTIKVVLNIQGNDWKQDTFTADQLMNAFNWAFSVAGIVAVIFIIKGGIEYVISRGDPGRIQKAMREIVFAVAGLVIVLLAAAIANFVISATAGAM